MHEIAEVLARVTTASIGPPLVPAAAMPTLADAPPRVAPSVVRPAPASTPRVLVFLGGFAAVLLASLVAVAVVLLVRSPPADAPLASAAVSTPPRASPAPAPSPAGDAPAESAVASAPSSSAPPRRTVRASPARSAAPPLAPATSTPAAAVCAPFTTLEVSARDFEGTVPLPALAAWERAIRGPLTACYRGTAAPVCAGTRVTIGVRLHGGKRHESSGIGTSAYGDGELPPAQCLFAAVDHDVPQPTVATTFQQLRIELR